MRWKDESHALGRNAGQLFLVVGFVSSNDDARPDVVILQGGDRNVWGWGVVWSWSELVQSCQQEP